MNNLSNIPLKEAKKIMNANPKQYKKHKHIENQFKLVIFPKMANLLKKPLVLEKDYEDYSLKEIYDLYFEALENIGYSRKEVEEVLKGKRH